MMRKALLVLTIFLTALFSCKSPHPTGSPNPDASGLGIGLVSIHFDEKTTLNFYASPTDKESKRTLQFFNDTSIQSWNIRELDQHRASWLSPQTLWLDYHQFVFRCTKEQKGWQKVIVNNETQETLWLKKSNLTTFETWEQFLTRIVGVARLQNHQQKIRTSPMDNAEEMKYEGRDCFKVKSMNGDWIEIFTPDHCTETETKIKSGWIKWRQGNKLCIEYFTTC